MGRGHYRQSYCKSGASLFRKSCARACSRVLNMSKVSGARRRSSHTRTKKRGDPAHDNRTARQRAMAALGDWAAGKCGSPHERGAKARAARKHRVAMCDLPRAMQDPAVQSHVHSTLAQYDKAQPTPKAKARAKKMTPAELTAKRKAARKEGTKLLAGGMSHKRLEHGQG